VKLFRLHAETRSLPRSELGCAWRKNDILTFGALAGRTFRRLGRNLQLAQFALAKVLPKGPHPFGIPLRVRTLLASDVNALGNGRDGASIHAATARIGYE